MAIRNPYPGIHAYVCESFHAFLVTPNPARRRCEYTVDDVAAAAEYRDAARYRYRTPLATPPPAEVDSVAASYPELTQPHSDEVHGADVAYTFGGAVAHAAVATPAAAAAMPSRRHHAAGMETQAPEVEPETGDTVLHHPLQYRADVRYYSINHHLVPTRPNRNWRSLLPPGWHPRACPAWARLRVGQVSTSFSPEDVAIVIEGFAGVRVQHVEAQANGVGLFMVWVSRKDVLAVLSLARAFVCDREGVWAAPPGSGQLPRDICRDGVYREGVAKCPVTIEVPRGRDTMWD